MTRAGDNGHRVEGGAVVTQPPRRERGRLALPNRQNYIREKRPRVCEVVLEMTDDKRLPKEERKRLQIEHAADLSDLAKLVKLGDKIANVRDQMSSPPVGWDEQRRRAYLRWREQVVAGCRGMNQELEDLYDAALREALTQLDALA